MPKIFGNLGQYSDISKFSRPTINLSPFTASTFPKTPTKDPKNQNLLLQIFSNFRPLTKTSLTGNSPPPLSFPKSPRTSHEIAANSLLTNLATIKLAAQTLLTWRHDRGLGHLSKNPPHRSSGCHSFGDDTTTDFRVPSTHHTRLTHWESLPLACFLHIPSLSNHTHCTEAVGPSITPDLLRLPLLLSPPGEANDNNHDSHLKTKKKNRR